MIRWLLDDPAGIGILTLVASALVGAATWIVSTMALVVVAAAVKAVLWLRVRWSGRRPWDA